jgi:hypothetical protein
MVCLQYGVSRVYRRSLADAQARVYGVKSPQFVGSPTKTNGRQEMDRLGISVEREQDTVIDDREQNKKWDKEALYGRRVACGLLEGVVVRPQYAHGPVGPSCVPVVWFLPDYRQWANAPWPTDSHGWLNWTEPAIIATAQLTVLR